MIIRNLSTILYCVLATYKGIGKMYKTNILIFFILTFNEISNQSFPINSYGSTLFFFKSTLYYVVQEFHYLTRPH
jgi:ABC-type transport system involved in cytochrome c biogenesis permease subunit